MVFDTEGRIVEHIDYWDAAEHIYEMIPWFGALMRWIKKRLQGS
jgi:steroid delta-isomerase